jgi:hypothetical protein
MNKGMNMNYRNEVLDMTRFFTAQQYNLPVAAYFLAQAVEQVAEYWFEGSFEFACGMDAQEAVFDSTLAHLVMVKYFELEQEANVKGAGF